MIWFVGIFISLLLLSSEMLPAAPVDNIWLGIVCVITATLCVPLFASIQSIVVVKRWTGIVSQGPNARHALCSLYFGCVSIWACCSLAIVAVFQWPTIVREHWQLARLPLFDELMVVLPIVASITIAWILLYGAEQVLLMERRELLSLRRRVLDALQIAGSRFRLIFGIILLPVAILFLSRDLVRLVVSPECVGQWTTWILFVDLIILVGLYPWLISKTWQTSKIKDPVLSNRLQSAAAEFAVGTIKTRLWDTRNQMANAVVVGLVPKTRTVFLSDVLVEQFEPDEVEAIYRHELAHLRCRHLPLRLLFLILPIVVGGLILSQTGNGAMFICDPSTLSQSAIIWIVIAAGLAYYILFVNWMVRQTEIEADLVACMDSNDKFDQQRAETYRLALLRMSVIMPELYDRPTLAHPSIQSRLCWLGHCSVMPSAVKYFRRRLRRVQILVLALVVSSTLLLRVFVGG